MLFSSQRTTGGHATVIHRFTVIVYSPFIRIFKSLKQNYDCTDNVPMARGETRAIKT